MKYNHIFGPVPSRRLGLSLGVDLVRHKTCSLDCIYCECGPTTNLTLKRAAYVPFDEVKAELAHYFENHPDPDYVTFSGSGEPTLSPDIGRIIDFIKEKKAKIRVAVLTNATLLSDPVGVRKDLNRADLVMPSLDAVTPQTFEKINRPAGQIDIHKVIDGIKTFAESFQGELWLEVFILPGINDAREELEIMGKIIRDINPNRVQLNTLDRPGAISGLKPASKHDLDRVAGIIDAANVEIIARVELASRDHISDETMEAMIMETIHRRPCTIDDLTAAMNLEKGKLEILMKRLILQNKIESVQQERGMFYQTIKKSPFKK